MKIVNLVENTCGTKGCTAAHGLSFYIETPRHRLLMDAGPSGELLLQNAEMLGVDLRAVDTAVLSHGHYDHSDGLPAFAKINPNARIYMRRGAADDFRSVVGAMHYIGIDRAIPALPGVVWVEGGLRIDEELSLFGDIPGRRAWPAGNRLLLKQVDGACEQDDFSHEQCLVIECQGLRVLLSGCAHSGILNILDRFGVLYGGTPDVVLSGFHMMKDGDYTAEEWDDIEATARALTETGAMFYTGHCTSLPAYARMKEIMSDRLAYIHCGDAIAL